KRLDCGLDDVEQLAARPALGGPGSLELEDRGADVLHREVEVVDRQLYASLCGGGGAAEEAHGALEGKAGGEESLDDGVVQLACDALAVLDEGQLLDPGVQAGVLDRD